MFSDFSNVYCDNSATHSHSLSYFGQESRPFIQFKFKFRCKDMDSRLTLLLICLCSEGLINAEVADSEAIPLVPLIPLLPSQPIADLVNETTQVPGTPNTTEAPSAPTSRPDGSSSEEDQEENCKSSAESWKAITTAVERLGMKLLQNLETTPEQPNVIISPLSISLALSQLALGAANMTEELLMYHLHAKSVPCFHQALHNLLVGIRSDALKIAMRIFLHQGFEPKQEFLQESLQLYGSEPVILEDLQQINDWVKNATQGQMTDFLSALPANLLLMLINAVHFKGQWKTQFDPRFTSKGVFYVDDKHMVDVDMMEDTKHPLSLFIDNELESQVASFPFKESMSLLVVMPLSGQVNVSALAPKMRISSLYERLPKEKAVQVKIPKFKLEYSQELQEVFSKLGLGGLFSAPNLSRIADGPLVVSSVLHKSSMEINEEGAEASAATSVVISRASNPIFYLNQPFFFVLMDDKLHVPIFMGVINNPNPTAPFSQQGEPGRNDKIGFPTDKNQARPFPGPPK
ncbi:serpin peptidase inhibitor, clade F (alpha-2 antiplasmin, pigment epithelium derived factor), member 2b [Genypterus blacodes]|uniref:serpin peptidase inhibitor, clade F (alpha-2 antiplasmin, pigment epithelium derived factor), member 2b n=1 Tax=Genypterus blacodes TaxID=154954 RepID=UPI003F75AEF1